MCIRHGHLFRPFLRRVRYTPVSVCAFGGTMWKCARPSYACRTLSASPRVERVPRCIHVPALCHTLVRSYVWQGLLVRHTGTTARDVLAEVYGRRECNRITTGRVGDRGPPGGQQRSRTAEAFRVETEAVGYGRPSARFRFPRTLRVAMAARETCAD